MGAACCRRGAAEPAAVGAKPCGNLSADGSQAVASSSTAEAPTQVRLRIVDQLHEASEVWMAGVCDALTLHECVFFLARSEVIRLRTAQCFVLNGVIFMGSILLFDWAVEPTLGILRRLVHDDEVWATDLIAAAFSILYKVLWIYPIYCISFVLNTVMYQEVADSALALVRSTPPLQTSPPLARLINETFRVLMNFIYIVQINLMYYLPRVGPALYFVHSCWLASIYCFEYRWVHLQWTSNQRVEHLETSWLYYAGFGFPISLLCFFCPRFIDTGVFALLFPLCILKATTAEPKKLRKAPQTFRRLPVFFVVQSVSCRALRSFEGRMASSATSQAESAGASASPSRSSPASADDVDTANSAPYHRNR